MAGEKTPAGRGAPRAPRREKHNLQTLVAEARAFIDADLPARNKLFTDPVLGIDPQQAARMKAALDATVERIKTEHGEASAEQENDFLLEDIIAWVMHHDVNDRSDNFDWLPEGDGFKAHELGDKRYRTDAILILPQTEIKLPDGRTQKIPPIPVSVNATTGEKIGPTKKMWLSLYDLATTGHFGVVPFVTVRMRGAPTAQAAGLVGAPHVTLAASREWTARFAGENIRALKLAKERKELYDPKDAPLLTNLPDDQKSRAEWDARARITARRRAIETIEERIRTHDMQLIFATQMLAQFRFFRRFAMLLARRIDRALYKTESGAELPEPAWVVESDKRWGDLGVPLPKDAARLRIVRANLNSTIDQLGNCIAAGEAARDAIIRKLLISEREQEKPLHRRQKRFAREHAVKNITHEDPADLALITLAEDEEVHIALSKLRYTDLGFERPPKTKMW